MVFFIGNDTPQVVEKSSVTAFRDFAREIRKPRPYQLGVSECKGVLNIIIGLGQILVCPYFKITKADKFYEIHMNAGVMALDQGTIDLTPAIAVTVAVVAGLELHKWIQN